LDSDARIEAVVREAVLEIARVATAGGARASLARVTGQVLVELASELTRLGLTQQVIADMLGMAPRTYHRRVQQARGEQGERRTVRDEVLEFVRGSGQVTARAVQQQFLRHPGELVAGVLHDLVHCGLARRRGWGDEAVYRAVAREAVAPDALGSCEPVRQVRVAGQRR
jgi:transcriptional regulator with XRE-family HTH domain